MYADASAAIGVANREGLGRIRHLDTQSLWLQQALRQRRLGLGKVLGTQNPSDLMTKHVDSKLFNQHARCMGCDFMPGRAELAPQVVQEIEDQVEYVEDNPCGLMTAPEGPESTTIEVHCALETELCLLGRNVGQRLTGDVCRGGDEAKGRSFNRQREYNQVDRDHNQGIQTGEHLRGHPCFVFSVAVWAISFEGRCLF